jgi:hypothetical protein
LAYPECCTGVDRFTRRIRRFEMKWNRVCRHCGHGGTSVIWAPGVGWYCHECGTPYVGLPEPPDLLRERDEARARLADAEAEMRGEKEANDSLLTAMHDRLAEADREKRELHGQLAYEMKRARIAEQRVEDLETTLKEVAEGAPILHPSDVECAKCGKRQLENLRTERGLRANLEDTLRQIEAVARHTLRDVPGSYVSIEQIHRLACAALGMTDSTEICEWCDRPVNDGWGHGEGQCFDKDTGEPIPRPDPVHTDHCNCRQAWGDGECECGRKEPDE